MAGFAEFRARIAQVAAVIATNVEQSVMPVTNEFRETVLASYNWLTRSLRAEEINPTSQQYSEQCLAAALSLAAGTTYYPSANGMSMGGFKDLGTEFVLATTGAGDSIVLTLEATNDTTVPPAAGSWQDVTLAGYDLMTGAMAAPPFTAAGAASTVYGIVDWDNLNCRLFRVKIVVVKALNNSTLTIWTRQKAL